MHVNRVVLAATLMLMGVVGACTEFKTVECADGSFCPRGTVCSTVGGCVDPGQLGSCLNQELGAACSYPGVDNGVCAGPLCIPRGCGNTFIEPMEECDDGNNIPLDDCSADCRSNETCGNGIVDALKGESCDDGNTVDGDGCQGNCVFPSCGDGVVDAEFNETCDCGTDADSQNPACDDNNSNDVNATCRPNCQPARCGDGIVDDETEACDDGNFVLGDGCSPDCASDEVCGNGVTDFLSDEECDDGNLLNHDGCSSQCTSESPQWTRRLFGGSFETPPGRSDYGMAYDSASGKTVLFAGRSGTGVALSDTWEWDGESWHERQPANFPTPRSGHTLTYDVARAEVVFFAGGDNATWHWDGTNWTRDFSNNAPPPRREHAAVYDAARQTVFVFGGIDSGDGVNAGLPLADTWEWDGSDWTERVPVTSPPARSGHNLAFDPGLGQVLLYGGEGRADTWTWDGTDWTELSPANTPGERFGHAMVHDPIRGRIVLFGGFNSVGTALNDTWEWNGSNWVQAVAVGPSVRGQVSLVFEGSNHSSLLFSGASSADGTSVNAESWQWNGTAWAQKIPNPTPAARSGHSIAYQGSRGRHVLFGGLATGGASRLSDTWEWHRGHWAEVVVAGPSARDGHAMAFDAARSQTLLFGGSTPALQNDTWVWNGASWNQLVVAGAPSARQGHALAYDAVGERVILFGGDTGTLQNDTWSWNGSAWQQLTPITSPPARSGHTLGYDPILEEVVLFGGSGSGAQVLDDTWIFRGGNWILQAPADTPVERSRAGMAYNTARGSLILYGGSTAVNMLDDTWEWAYTSALGNWDQHALSTRPGFREAHAMSGDATSSDVLLFGGVDSAGTALDTTLTFRFEAGVEESCTLGFDADRDGRLGCDDEDCWGFCAPQCPPGAACDPTSARCGDGTCNLDLESCRLCPGDCGACTTACGDFICEGTESLANCPGDCT